LQQQYSDFSFVCREKNEFVHLPVHRVIVNQTPALEEMLEQKEKAKVLIFGEIDSTTMKDVLRFLYTRNIDAVELDDIVNILKVAEKFQMDDLIKLCISKVMEKDYDDKTFSLLDLAIDSEYEDLEKFCLGLICM
jgi:hypothetical protein